MQFISLFLATLFLLLLSCTKKASDTENKKTEASTPQTKTEELSQSELNKLNKELQLEFSDKPDSSKTHLDTNTDSNTKEKKSAVKPEDILKIKLKTGTVVIHLNSELAPLHAERIRTLTKQGFYDGLSFHRVIDDFMAQTGDPKGDGSGGSELPDLKAEFNKTPFKRGVVGMARANSPHSANSQFFIMFDEAPHLNGMYTVIGSVVSGMDHIDKIKKGDGPNGKVTDPDKIISATIGR